MATSEDEFDELEDTIDFSAMDDAEWNAIQTQQTQSLPPPSHVPPQESTANAYTDPLYLRPEREFVGIGNTTPEFVEGSYRNATHQRRSASPYLFDDDADLDSSFFHQLDALEEQLFDGTSGRTPALSEAPNIIPSSVTVEIYPDVTDISPSCPDKASKIPDTPQGSLKRRRSSEEISTSNKKGKSRVDWSDLVSENEEELTCPICCDILAAAHLVNGCGHTLCGSCGYEWIREKHKLHCPTCRAICHAITPLIPNVVVDNFVYQHLRMLVLLGDDEWKEPGGSKFLEWTARKEKWKEDCEARAKRPSGNWQNRYRY